MSLLRQQHKRNISTRVAAEPEAQKVSIQQEDNEKDFYKNIMDFGFQYQYESERMNCIPQKYGKATSPKHVIIVGAGMSGLVAAYELEQTGHKTTILEMANRVGGRVKTLHEFPSGLHAEGGAMRLPPTHFLTWHYLQLFKIKTRPFKNENVKGRLYLYGENISLEEWKKENDSLTTHFWPGWDANLPEEIKRKEGIKGILDLYEKTIQPVKDEILNDHSVAGWNRWVQKWSKISMLEFFRSDQYQDPNGLQLRPWAEQAILAYKVSGYKAMLDISMVEYLREELGGWLVDKLKTPEDGMSALPEAFIMPNKFGWNQDVNLEKRIQFGVRVESVEVNEKTKQVTVKGRNTCSGKIVICEGDAVILTLPLTILRQLKLPLSHEHQKALAGITYMPSTKVLLQFRRRFWQDTVGQGGFTKTNRPIGQIHYPGWDGSSYTTEDRGILLFYTYGQDALILGGQTTDQAVASTLRELCDIHPEAEEYFEHGVMQAWFNDPAAQGAFACLHPFEYNDNMQALKEANHPVYLAGEAISWANGWIQGAIMSALNTAYRFYEYNEDNSPPPNKRPRKN